MDRLEIGLATTTRQAELMLLFVDLDDFKMVNDEYGHDIGDEVLVHTATRLLDATRAADTIARLGGDEFVILLDDTTADEAAFIAERITEALRQPVQLGAHTIRITASLGMATADAESTAAILLRQADQAMYRAKADGRDRISL